MLDALYFTFLQQNPDTSKIKCVTWGHQCLLKVSAPRSLGSFLAQVRHAAVIIPLPLLLVLLLQDSSLTRSYLHTLHLHMA